MGKKYLKNFTGRLIITAFFALVQIVFFIVMVIGLSTQAIWVYAALNFVSLAVVIFVVNRRQNPAFKLIWSIIILTFPVFGGFMYIAAALQGSTFRFKKRAERAHKAVAPYVTQDEETLSSLRARSRTFGGQAAYVSKKAGYPLHASSDAVYLPSGEETFERLRTELESAKRFIFMEFFIIQEGIMWDTLLKILIAKAKAGVDVRLIWDGMGSLTTLPKNYDKILRSLGIKVMIFNPFVPLATVVQNNRDHRKIVVVDGHTAITGGVNLADEYINAYERFGHWKDSAILLRGEAVTSFTTMFLEHWYFDNKPDEDIASFLYNPAEAVFVPRGVGFVQPLGDSPLDDEDTGELVYLNLISKATEYVWFATPYLIPDNELVTALCFAAKSGVDVRLVTPHIPDKRYAFLVTRSFYSELIEAGVRIYEYTPGFIHQKTCVVDGRVAEVGSINLDYRSLYLHFECAALIYDDPVILDVKRDLDKIFAASEEITAEACRVMRRKSGLAMSLLRLLSPLF